MDALMLDEVGCYGNALATEEDAKDVDGIVFPEWDESVMDDFHVNITNANDVPLLPNS